MTADLDDVLYSSLCQPMPAIGYYLSRTLSGLFPEDVVFEGVSPAFNVEAYAGEGLCELSGRSVPYAQRQNYWLAEEKGHLGRAHNQIFDVVWESERLRVLIAHWPEFHGNFHYFILAPSLDLANRFHSAVCAWNTKPPDDYILVFDVNGWNRDEALLAAIASATLDTLVLRGTLKEDIVADVTSFFAAKETYAEYGVPWKRGILFVGTPGNGKTHAVKSLVNALDQRCVYVKTFGGGGPDQFGIRTVFQQARDSAPCLLVLEDLDSLITPYNRSYFLNELDGFAGNDGILTLATTNHPERLDPAILDRPSRFDRKYPFDLPQQDEREAYIEKWNETLRPALQLSAEGVTSVTLATDGFSFAYLKELFLSALMRWIAAPEQGAMDGIADEQVEMLRDHMAYVTEAPADLEYGMQGGYPHPGMRRHMYHGPGGPHGPMPARPQDVPL